MKTKICTNPKCKKEKLLSEFGKHSGHKDGLQSQCKECIKKLIKFRYLKNKEEILIRQKKYNDKNKVKKIKYDKQYRDKNEEKIKKLSKKYRDANKEEIAKRHKKWYDQNKEKVAKYIKQYYDRNKEKILKQRKEYRKNKLKNDINFKILHNLRRRINNALKGNTKSLNTMILIECEIDYLMFHIQKQFTKSMSWDNYGLWHIDHKLPCASFDLSKPSEQRKCFNYRNLQPLWAIDNLKKSNKIL